MSTTNIAQYIEDLLKNIEKRKAYELSVIEYLEKKKPIDAEIEKRKNDYKELEGFLDGYLKDYKPSDDEKCIIGYIDKLVERNGEKQRKEVDIKEFCDILTDANMRKAYFMSLEEPRDLNETTENEVESFLHIRFNRLDSLKKLLTEESVRTNVEYNKHTMLSYAVLLKRVEIVNYLLAEKKITEDPASSGMTSFDHAAQNGQLDILKKLLEDHHVLLDYSNETIQSIIKVATVNCQLNVIQWWFQNVKSIPDDLTRKSCLLHKIRILSNENDVKANVNYFLTNSISPIDINDLDEFGNTILNTAFLHSCDPVSVSLVDFFIQKGIDIKIKNKENIGLMQRAVESGNLELVEYLLNNKDLKLDDIDIDGNTTLIIASKLGYFDIVKFILAKNLPKGFLNKVNKEEFTALDYALRNRYDRIADILLNLESRIADTIRNGELHNFISFKKYIPYPQLLLTDLNIFYNSSFEINNNSGLNYVDVYPWRIKEFKEKKSIGEIDDYAQYGQLLYSNYTNPEEVKTEHDEECENREYCAIVKNTFVKLSLGFIDKLNLQDSKTRYSSTLLHISAAYGRNDIIIWLFSNKFNMKSVDDYGNTALYYAAMNNLPETIILLKLLGLNELFIGECKFINGHIHQYVVGNDSEFYENLVLLQVLKAVRACNRYQVSTDEATNKLLSSTF